MLGKTLVNLLSRWIWVGTYFKGVPFSYISHRNRNKKIRPSIGILFGSGHNVIFTVL
jgi:hypothetical protein